MTYLRLIILGAVFGQALVQVTASGASYWWLLAALWFGSTLTSRWGLYLNATLFGEGVGFILSPVLAALATDRLGRVDNGNAEAVEPRLPRWLAWFDTPDNSLLGDPAHRQRHAKSTRYWQKVCWLARNRFYGGKWSVLAAPMDVPARVILGDPSINRNNGRCGTLKIAMGPYWQWKSVRVFGATGYGWMLNFGWLLDDADQPRGLFMFSPRIVKMKRSAG